VSPVRRPTRTDVLVFATVGDLHAWLEQNHDSATEAFIGYFRKGVAKPSITYAQAVEEALCFGWIDGITFRVDDEVTTNRFTPRRPTSNWSAINIGKVAELTAAGRMQPAGLRAFEQRDRRKDATYSYEQPLPELTAEMLDRLGADPNARRGWESETKSFRRQATYWIMSAKRPETRDRRFAELVESVAAGRRPSAWPSPRDRRGR
jgi:uncharacterized protein YdeI (YjbR/CyaY-like superfamily)